MFRWNEEKNLKLIQERGVSFEEAVEVMRDEGVLDHYRHPNTDKYPNQYIFVVRLKGYVHYVPYVREGEDIFLKNIIPSRKLNKKYT
jgi:uncharacterized DUF497 family protein